ncbi:unnamed protein product [Pylaiella littoralis]
MAPQRRGINEALHRYVSLLPMVLSLLLLALLQSRSARAFVMLPSRAVHDQVASTTTTAAATTAVAAAAMGRRRRCRSDGASDGRLGISNGGEAKDGAAECFRRYSSSSNRVGGNRGGVVLSMGSSSSSSGSDKRSVEEEWPFHKSRRSQHRYQIVAAEAMEGLGERLEELHPDRFRFHKTSWGKFPDGTDNIEIGGFTPHNVISGEHVLFLASFHNNDVTLSQFQVMICLLQYFVESLTVVLPYYPTGTMERVIKEGQVATANTYAQMFSNLPSCGKPTRLLVYDLHTLQNRFYLHGNAIASLQTSIPLLVEEIKRSDIDCIAFPDDGAAKRFAHMFADLGYHTVICGKVRDGETRSITIQDGDPAGKNIIIVDDLVQTGGTLYECGVALKAAGAGSVQAFVAHGVFPKEAWKRFAKGGDRCVFDRFLVTNSIPTTTDKLPRDDVYVVLDLVSRIKEDLDLHSSI